MKEINDLQTKLYLSDLKKGDEGIVEKIHHYEENLARLADMGLHQGTVFRVVSFAPLGDPIEIKIRGFYLSVRRSQAKNIQVIKKEFGVS